MFYRTLLSLSLVALCSVPMAAQRTKNFANIGQVVRLDPRLDAILAPDAKLEVIASGFEWSEGPVWSKQGNFLLFSDIPRNSVMKWTPEQGVSLYMKPAGYTGITDYGHEPGSNGLFLDKEGRLLSCEHGDRRISRLEPGGGKRTLADNYQGKRLNSPNDLTQKSNGDIYFTDPIYGLPDHENDKRRELSNCGVYRVKADGTVTLLTAELSRPNGIAFSPDEKTLFVANSDPDRAIWMSFPVKDDGTLGAGKIFADVTGMVKQHKGLPDGMKIDRNGNLFASGPGGIHIYAPDGKLLGRIDTGEATSNCAWGDDGSTLYITADMYVCRIKTKTRGNGW